MNEATYKTPVTLLDDLELDEEQVARYLAQHADFFEHQATLLNSLSVPHPAHGETVSLVERQVASLRNENNQLKQQLGLLISNAGENDELLEKTKTLVLSLISAGSFEQLKLLVEQSMTREFGSNCCRLWRVMEGGYERKKQHLSEQYADKHLKRIIKDEHPNCGILKDDEKQILFDEKSSEVGSAATLPLFCDGKLVGILSIGNGDPDYYRNNMSTSLLSFIGAVIARILCDMPE